MTVLAAEVGGFPLLTSVVIVPVVGAVLTALVSRRRPEQTRLVALLFTIGTGALTIAVLAVFKSNVAGFQLVDKTRWIRDPEISWALGVDGISLWLIVLTGILFPLALLGAPPHHDEKPFYAWLLLLEAGCLGAFLALDLFLFFLMFEIVLVPMYFLISGWGYAERRYAAVKFFLYTMFGSAFLLVGTIALAFLHAKGGPVTFDLRILAEQQGMVAATTARWLFLSFAIAFAVKVPLFPVHTWLPDAHTQAPTAGSVILAGVMLKLGTYGFLRFGLYLFPEASVYFAPFMVTLGVIGIIYGAICAAMQKDLKRLVAYSSVAHLGFIALGTFALTTQSVQGGVLQMINHGVSTGALFLLVGMIYERRHTRQISELKGLQKSAPIMAAVFTVVMLSSLGLPGLNGFVGEFLILLGSFITRRWWTVVALFGVVLAALYLLWAYQRVFHGEADEPNATFREMRWTEGLVMAPLVALIVFMGVYPRPILDRIAPSVNRLVLHVERNSDYRQPKIATNEPRAVVTRSVRVEGRAMIPFLAQLGPVTRIDTPNVEWSALMPMLVLLGGAVVLLVAGALLPRRTTFGWPAAATIVIALGSIGTVVPLWFRVRDDGPLSVVANAIRIDGFALFFAVVIAGALILAVLLTDGYLRREDLEGPEPYVLLLLSASGGLVMASANDLIVMFLGLEVLSIAVYVLAGMHTCRKRSAEAALKYFVLGGFSSAFFLYGIALVYGATGTTNLSKIATFLATNVLAEDGLLLAGFALLLVGFGFKIAAVPFHSWSPDVYEGSPSPIVAFMASGVKVAGFAGLLRVFVFAFSSYRVDWQPIIYALAVLSLLVGAVLAVVQTNVKRMLAYSSISHAGFILVGVQAANVRGVSGAMFYLAAYTLMVAGSFGVVTIVGRRGDDRHDLSDYRGLGRAEPLLAFAFMVFLLAQAGVPFTSGFLAKFYVLGAAIDAHSYSLALVAMLSSVISAYLYLRIITTMYANSDSDEAQSDASDAGHAPARKPRLPIPAAARAALVIAVVGTIGLGLVPGPLHDASRHAVPRLAAGR